MTFLADGVRKRWHEDAQVSTRPGSAAEWTDLVLFQDLVKLMLQIDNPGERMADWRRAGTWAGFNTQRIAGPVRRGEEALKVGRRISDLP